VWCATRIVSLEAAVSEIQQACEGAGGDPTRSPFFLIVGAGISYPQVPLAATLVDHCKEVANKYGRFQEPQQDRALDVYSHWFDLAYPHPRQRQQYLRDLIKDQPISLANLRLAHLLSARKLTNLVVTTNFDDLLSRALRLFGQVPAVCDHPSTVGRIDPDRDDLQLVHVHGSYLFYDCANLQGEVVGRAQLDQETSLTIVGLLDSLLWTRSPLVVGYSGWEGDVIMTALRRRLGGSHSLGQSIYWFCYQRSNIDSLPPWLQNSNHVRFVAPPDRPQTAEVARGQSSRPTAGSSPVKSRSEAHDTQGPTLPASEVFEQLIASLDAGMPGLLQDPLNFFAIQLESSLPPDKTAALIGDPYSFKTVIQRIRQAAAAVPGLSAPSEIEDRLDALRNAMRRSQYEEGVRIAAKIVSSSLASISSEQRQEVLAAAALSGGTLLGRKAGPDLAVPIAQAMLIDPVFERAIGPLPDDTVFLMSCRSDQWSYESDIQGIVCGAFGHNVQKELQRAAADQDGDGRVSLHEAVVAASAKINQSFPQTPVILGNADSVWLYATKIPPRTSPKPRLLAVLVGINVYSGGFNLAGPVNDAAGFQKMITEGRRRLFRDPLVEQLTDEQATAPNIRAKLQWLTSESGPDDLVVFCFSGHGLYPGKHPMGVLCTHEYDGKGGGELTFLELVQKLKEVRAQKKIVILDAG